jgi:hypothetical protein
MSNDRQKYGHRWIERLQEIPQYMPVVEKLLKGQSLDEVADWLMEQPDRGPFAGLKRSTIRYYLNALNVRLRENARESRKNDQTLRAQRLSRLADEFTSGMTPGTDVAAPNPEPTEEEIEAAQNRRLRSMIDKLNSDGLVRLMLEKHLPYIDHLEEMEVGSKKPVKDRARNMDVLNSAATILQKNEVAQKLLDAQIAICSPVPAELSQEAKAVAQLTDVDRQLLRDAGEKLLALLKRRNEEAA